jgi:hypothetical protein
MILPSPPETLLMRRSSQHEEANRHEAMAHNVDPAMSFLTGTFKIASGSELAKIFMAA